MLLLLIRNQTIWKRILQHSEAQRVGPYLSDLASLQTWLADNGLPTAVLLDPQWPRGDEARRLFERNGISVTSFNGHFTQAEDWLREHVSIMESQTSVIEHSEDSAMEDLPIISEQVQPSFSPVSDVHENPLLRRPPARISPRQVETLELQSHPVAGAKLPEQERIVERIVEVQVEKPIYLREEIPTALAPVFIAVVGLWPRAGASLMSLVISEWLSHRVPTNGVTVIEDPRQPPRLFDYFAFEESYTHWLEDGRGTSLVRQGIQFVPMKPGLTEQVDEEKLVEYIYRQLKRPYTILDAGQQLEPSLIFELADHIVVVLDCDPTLLNIPGMAEAYHRLRNTYQEKVHVILNKWTKYVTLIDPETKDSLFPDAVKVPYLNPQVVQQALWKGSFLGDEVHEDLSMLYNKLLAKWVPKDSHPVKQHKSIFGRFRKS